MCLLSLLPTYGGMKKHWNSRWRLPSWSWWSWPLSSSSWWWSSLSSSYCHCYYLRLRRLCFPYRLSPFVWFHSDCWWDYRKSYGLTLLKFGKQVEMRLKQIQSDVCIDLASGLLLLCIWIYLHTQFSVHPSQVLVHSNEITGDFTDGFWLRFQERSG